MVVSKYWQDSNGIRDLIIRLFQRLVSDVTIINTAQLSHRTVGDIGHFI